MYEFHDRGNFNGWRKIGHFEGKRKRINQSINQMLRLEVKFDDCRIESRSYGLAFLSVDLTVLTEKT